MNLLTRFFVNTKVKYDVMNKLMDEIEARDSDLENQINERATNSTFTEFTKNYSSDKSLLEKSIADKTTTSLNGNKKNVNFIGSETSLDSIQVGEKTLQILDKEYRKRFIEMAINNVNSILVPTSTSTFQDNVFTQTGIFNGIKGFVDGRRYILSVRPLTEGYYTIKTLLSGTWREIYINSKYLKANEEVLITLTNTWNVNKVLCMFHSDGTETKSFNVFLYDITDISSELLPLIDFSNSSGVVNFNQITLPEEGVKSQALSKNCITEEKVKNNSISISKIKSHLYNKFGSFLGDSLTAAGSGSHYITYLNEILGFSGIKNCGIGGTRVSGTGNDCFWQDYRVNTLDLTSDFINIMGGTNDAPYTTVSDSDFTLTNCDTNNFVGAYNVLISKIYYKYLKQSAGYYTTITYTGVTQVDTTKPIEIILVTPPKRFDSVDNLKKVEQFAEYVKRIGKMWGLRVVDSNNLMAMNDINKDLYTTSADRLHFNKDAHKLLADVWIKEVIQ